MKTLRFFIVILAAIAVLASCDEDMVIDNPVGSTIHDDINTVSDLVVEINSENSQGAQTRVAYSGWATTFETNDQIGVYCWNGTTVVAANVLFTKQSNGTWTTVTGTRVPYNSSYTYFCYFPYNSSHGYTPGTSGNADTRFATFIADANNKFWKADQSTKANYNASNLMVGAGTHVGSGNKVRFAMDHKRGLAVFEGEDATDATFTGNIPYLMSSTQHFLMKPSVSTSFTDDSGTYSMTAPSGKYVTHNVVIPWTDLSMVDNAGNARASMTTANCYMVHKKGKYMLPLVYGNAIKNGVVNTVAFNPGGETTSTYCSNFVNHSDNPITGPWVTKSGSGVSAGMGLTASSAELLWQDASGLISTVGIDGDYLTFKVGTFNPGNALIAVKDGSGTILWSWHIWATEEDLSNTSVISTEDHDYTVAAVNLGWVQTNIEGQYYFPYYQWGRKDPFIPSVQDGGMTDHIVYNISNTSTTGITRIASTTETIADNIKNPTCFYYNTSGPVTTTYYNMWDAQNTAKNNVTTATKKTIYDPCPPGFCVPTGNLYYYMSNNGLDRNEGYFDLTYRLKLWKYSDPELFFPIGGNRSYDSGKLGAGDGGYFWAATPGGNRTARRLIVQSQRWAWQSQYRSYGCAVRPVAEE